MSRLLAKFGEAALKPRKVGEVWYQAAISARRVAELRKQALQEGREWEFEEAPQPGKKHPYSRSLKGHKWDKQKPQRVAAIEEKLGGMQGRIDGHREARRDYLKGVGLLDKLLLTPKQIREKIRKV